MGLSFLDPIGMYTRCSPMQEPTHVGFGDNVLTDMIGKIVAEWARLRSVAFAS